MSIVRDITIQAREYLDRDEIMLFIGARQAGKTTILRQLQDEVGEKHPTYFINLEDPDYLRLLNESPKNLFSLITIDLKKQSIVFIDEIQYLKNPSNFLKYFYDEYHGNIKLIVSGSSAFYINDTFKDSLVGRKKIFEVHTLSFREFLRFKDLSTLSLSNFDHLSLSDRDVLQRMYGEYVLYGGYPKVVLAPIKEKEDILRDIAYSYIKKDIFESKVRKEEDFYKILKILASQVGSTVSASELSNTLDISKTAIDRYLSIMQSSFHIALVRPFARNIRTELTKMPKIFFMDLGLRNFFSGGFIPFETRLDKGALLENAVFRQFIETVQIDDIKFWRTAQQNEIDFIIREQQAYEVKATASQFKARDYGVFQTKYPDIPLNLVSYHIDPKQTYSVPSFAVWQIK